MVATFDVNNANSVDYFVAGAGKLADSACSYHCHVEIKLIKPIRSNNAKKYLREKHGVEVNFAVSSGMCMEHAVMLLERRSKSFRWTRINKLPKYYEKITKKASIDQVKHRIKGVTEQQIQRYYKENYTMTQRWDESGFPIALPEEKNV